MENFKLVLPEHLNHYGFLYGGYMLQWADEAAYIAASLDYPGHGFVTVGLNQVSFRQQVRSGSILRFETVRTKTGNSSVEYQVDVYQAETGVVPNVAVFSSAQCNM